MKDLINSMEGFLQFISYLFQFFTPLITLFSSQHPSINEHNNEYNNEALIVTPGRGKKAADEGKEEECPFVDSRLSMVEKQIAARGIKDTLVLDAMRKVKRHLFVPEHLRDMAYNDYPLPIGHGQTISQPYIVALMTELLELKGGEKVLEIGTGSGYQSAILAEIASQVFSIEIVNELAEEVEKKLKDLGYINIKVRASDGYEGWPEEAPFDAIIITAAPDHIPEAIIPQLKMGGSLVLPIGSYFQDLYKIKNTEKGIIKNKIASVRFVPMTGQAEGH